MVTRICISINNKCNLSCRYCHFHEKGKINAANMDVFQILDHVKEYASGKFKIGFVGNGEAFLDFHMLKKYIEYISDHPQISVYTITNGTVDLADRDWEFLEDHRVNVGFSIDGYKELHNLYRCGSFDHAMENVHRYKSITGHFPTFNATVGKESLNEAERVIDFFSRFGTRVTFSRMIGRFGISLNEYRDFLSKAEQTLFVRRGGVDCTMYGGRCGAGIDNFFFANGWIYYCGNCIDLPPIAPSSTTFYELEKGQLHFDRDYCYKESL